MPEEEGFRSIGQLAFGRDTCFLCRCGLAPQNRTDEHVIPKWVQGRFDLWNETLELLNGTTIPYRQLTIPCCFDCNNKHLEPLESQVRDATLLGAAAVEELGKGVLFLWLGKIFFGLIYKESLIPLDRRQPIRGNIMLHNDLERFSAHHVFLQSARIPFRWIGMFPASIFVYDLRQPSQPGEGFDLLDNYSAMTIGVRLGNVGLLAALQDG